MGVVKKTLTTSVSREPPAPLTFPEEHEENGGSIRGTRRISLSNWRGRRNRRGLRNNSSWRSSIASSRRSNVSSHNSSPSIKLWVTSTKSKSSKSSPTRRRGLQKNRWNSRRRRGGNEENSDDIEEARCYYQNQPIEEGEEPDEEHIHYARTDVLQAGEGGNLLELPYYDEYEGFSTSGEGGNLLEIPYDDDRADEFLAAGEGGNLLEVPYDEDYLIAGEGGHHMLEATLVPDYEDEIVIAEAAPFHQNKCLPDTPIGKCCALIALLLLLGISATGAVCGTTDLCSPFFGFGGPQTDHDLSVRSDSGSFGWENASATWENGSATNPDAFLQESTNISSPFLSPPKSEPVKYPGWYLPAASPKDELKAAIEDWLSGTYTKTHGRNINEWDVSGVDDFSYLFYGRKDIQDINISDWQTSQVTSMSNMFAYSNFNQDIGGWDVSNVTDFVDMFRGANKFNQDISNWDVTGATSMKEMFTRMDGFNQPLKGWNVANVKDFQGMFYLTRQFNQDLSTWDISSATSLSYLFAESAFNQDISGWDVSQVADFSSMFSESPFNQDISSWNVGLATDMGWMFSSTFFYDQPLNSWDVSGVQNFAGMFFQTRAFNQDISSWNVGSATSVTYMFAANTVFNQPLNTWDMSGVEDFSSMFRKGMYNQDIRNWNVKSGTDMEAMFYENKAFNQNLCYWGDDIQLWRAEGWKNMFVNTSCPNFATPVFPSYPASPLCHVCV